MTNLIPNLAALSGRYDAVLCDLWGCLHDGIRPFPDAVAALQQFRAGGGIVLLLTNSPRPRGSVLQQLDGIGVPEDAYDEVASSGDASQYGVASGMAGTRLYHIGPPKDEAFFTDLPDDIGGKPITRVPLDEAEGIVCTGLFDDRTETPEDYRPTLLYAKQKRMKLLCTNPDLVVDMGEKRLFCAGAIAALYTEMGGESLYFGKPHPPIYDIARRRLARIRAVPDDRVLAIGDGIHTDIQGGLAEGFDTLFITGGLSATEFGADPEAPDADRMRDWFDAHELSPTYAIPYLR